MRRGVRVFAELWDSERSRGCLGGSVRQASSGMRKSWAGTGGAELHLGAVRAPLQGQRGQARSKDLTPPPPKQQEDDIGAQS